MTSQLTTRDDITTSCDATANNDVTADRMLTACAAVSGRACADVQVDEVQTRAVM